MRKIMFSVIKMEHSDDNTIKHGNDWHNPFLLQK
jgi:hypothetical protein